MEYRLFHLQVLLEHQLELQAQVLLNITKNKKKKHDKNLILAKSKLSSIETLIFQALNDMEINHEGFITILKEKRKYERMKYILESENENNKNMRLSYVKSFFKK